MLKHSLCIYFINISTFVCVRVISPSFLFLTYIARKKQINIHNIRTCVREDEEFTVISISRRGEKKILITAFFNVNLGRNSTHTKILLFLLNTISMFNFLHDFRRQFLRLLRKSGLDCERAEVNARLLAIKTYSMHIELELHIFFTGRVL